MKVTSLSLWAAGAVVLLSLVGCSQATSDTSTSTTTGTTTTVVGSVTHPLYDLSTSAGQAWSSGYSGNATFSTLNGGTAATLKVSSWDSFTGPTLSPALDASTYKKFSVALEGTWSGGSYLSFSTASPSDSGFRVSLYDAAGSQAEFDVDTTTLGLSATAFKAATFDTSAAAFEKASGSSATAFDWTTVQYAKIYSMGGSGTLVVSNLGFN